MERSGLWPMFYWEQRHESSQSLCFRYSLPLASPKIKLGIWVSAVSFLSVSRGVFNSSPVE